MTDPQQDEVREVIEALRKEARCRADELNFDDVHAFHEHQLTWIAAALLERLALDAGRDNPQRQFVSHMERREHKEAATLAFNERNNHRIEAEQWDTRWKDAVARKP